jgi:hypothetical protein
VVVLNTVLSAAALARDQHIYSHQRDVWNYIQAERDWESSPANNKPPIATAEPISIVPVLYQLLENNADPK